MDETIKIWDNHNFNCIKTINTGRLVICLKNLTSNILTGGSMGEINIWDIENGDCVQRL